ncbi:MAG: hypothetical protein RSB66_06655 [Clostridium sp.]
MTRKDGIILGVITILASAFMFCYFSGFNKEFILWSIAATALTLGAFGFVAYKKGIFSNPNKKK